MLTWFLVCVLGITATLPIHFLSVEHQKLEKRYGKEKGIRVGRTCGLISGWGLFSFWIGIWVTPQPRFTILVGIGSTGLLPGLSFSIPFFHLIICILFVITGGWMAIEGVREITLWAAETHRTEQVVTVGVYSVVRHPQYLGGLLAHIGISFLLSALHSLLFTPVVLVIVTLISWKEEKELVKEFGRLYLDYKKTVPMLIPRFRVLQHPNVQA